MPDVDLHASLSAVEGYPPTPEFLASLSVRLEEVAGEEVDAALPSYLPAPDDEVPEERLPAVERASRSRRRRAGAGIVAAAAVIAVVVAFAAARTEPDAADLATTAAPGAAPTPATETTSAACVNLPGCSVSISRTSGLVDGDVVRVRIEGWRPHTATGVSQCEDAADPDNEDLAPGIDGLPPADVCNIEGLNGPSQTETSDADGVVAFDYVVRTGEQMTDESVAGQCDAEHDCQLIVFLSFDTRFRSDAPRVTIPLTFA